MYRDRKVVVVMPAYNAARTLRQTYSEVREQGLVDTIILYCPYFGVGLDETRENHANMLKIYAG